MFFIEHTVNYSSSVRKIGLSKAELTGLKNLRLDESSSHDHELNVCNVIGSLNPVGLSRVET